MKGRARSSGSSSPRRSSTGRGEDPESKARGPAAPADPKGSAVRVHGRRVERGGLVSLAPAGDDAEGEVPAHEQLAGKAEDELHRVERVPEAGVAQLRLLVSHGEGVVERCLGVDTIHPTDQTAPRERVARPNANEVAAKVAAVLHDVEGGLEGLGDCERAALDRSL